MVPSGPEYALEQPLEQPLEQLVGLQEPLVHGFYELYLWEMLELQVWVPEQLVWCSYCGSSWMLCCQFWLCLMQFDPMLHTMVMRGLMG